MYTTTTLALALSLAAPAPKIKEPEQKGPGYIGIMFQANGDGLLISEVKEDGPAKKADMRVGDVIIKIDDHDMVGAETSKLQKVVGEMKPGTLVAIKVKRNDEEVMIKLKLGVRPADFMATPKLPPIGDEPPPDR
jgi:C-terminal processing protease CtpA/Prc